MAKLSRKAQRKQERRLKVLEHADDALLSESGIGFKRIGGGDDSEEEDYESIPRQFAESKTVEEVEQLPVRTADGKIKRVVKKQKVKAVEEAPGSESEQEADEQDEQIEEAPEKTNPFDGMTNREQLVTIQERVAEIAEAINEDPEEQIGRLKQLASLFQNASVTKAKSIIILAQATIFKSLIPGYSIRPLTELEQKDRVSKEVKKLRNFEQSLVSYYKSYVTLLLQLNRAGLKGHSSKAERSLCSAAILSVTDLVESVPHFNFRSELVQIICEFISIKPTRFSNEPGFDHPALFDRCIKTIEYCFKQDDEGHVSFDFVKLISKMIKQKSYKGVEPSVLSTFLHLRLLTELKEIKEKKPERENIKKKDRVHLTKKERKQRKENRLIEQELAKAETKVSQEERERIQSETLKIVFVLYLNVLKERTALVGPVLEGLARFAHLVNADLFGDLLEILRELIIERQRRVTDDGNTEFIETTTREALLCISSAYALLAAQAGESMNLDLSFFATHLYSSLYTLALNPDIEFSYKALRLYDNDNSPRPNVNMSTEMEMVVRAFETIFFRQRTMSKKRCEAFAKRLATCTLQWPEKSSLAGLKVLDKLAKRFTAIAELFSTEDRVENGVFKMDIDDPEHCNPEAAVIWETVLLQQHYSPDVAKAAQQVANNHKTKN